MVLSVVIGRRRWGGSSDGSGGLFDSSSVWRRWFLMVVGAYDIDVAGLINKALPEQLGCQDAAGVTIWISGPSPESVAVRSGSGRFSHFHISILQEGIRPSMELWSTAYAPVLLVIGIKTVATISYENWFCGDNSFTRIVSYYSMLLYCRRYTVQVNHCCALHDNCYDLQLGRKKCDLEFCKCAEQATDPESCVLTDFSCAMLGVVGQQAYTEAAFYNEPDDFEKLVPAIHGVDEAILQLYEKCPRVMLSIKSCSIIADRCLVRNDQYSCRKDLANCLHKAVKLQDTGVCWNTLNDIDVQHAENDTTPLAMKVNHSNFEVPNQKWKRFASSEAAQKQQHSAGSSINNRVHIIIAAATASVAISTLFLSLFQRVCNNRKCQVAVVTRNEEDVGNE
ncbi:hypothetical protein Q1695_015481 [Nippostrongylus brasiliensis]|nr:hypothetical protein Q1695_015481 [Nippostrongylus brasiliensis]